MVTYFDQSAFLNLLAFLILEQRVRFEFQLNHTPDYFTSELKKVNHKFTKKNEKT